MTNNDSQETYEAPTFEPVGDLHEITKSGGAVNSDVLPFQNNTAFPPPTS